MINLEPLHARRVARGQAHDRSGDLGRCLPIEAVEPRPVGNRPIRPDVFLDPQTHCANGNICVTLCPEEDKSALGDSSPTLRARAGQVTTIPVRSVPASCVRGGRGVELLGLVGRHPIAASRLGRGGEVDHRLGNRQLPLGRAQEVVRLLGGEGDRERPRIGER